MNTDRIQQRFTQRAVRLARYRRWFGPRLSAWAAALDARACRWQAWVRCHLDTNGGTR